MTDLTTLSTLGRRKKQSFPLTFHSTSRPKRALLSVLTASFLGRRPRLAPAPGLWWCKHRDRRGADLESTAMTTRQTGKQAKTKAEAKVDPGVITNKPGGKTERQTPRRDARQQSRSVTAQTNRAAVTAAAAPKARSNDAAAVHGKPKQARPRAKPVAPRADLASAGVSGADQPPASTKRAKLIAMLQRSDGASVAEIGQRLGWLPHTVRAAVTGLRRAGRAVTRSKDADDRSVYRLAPVETSDKR